MICKAFPDLKWLKNQVNSGFANRQDWAGRKLSHQGWPTVVMNAKASQTYRDNIKGPLSLFTNISGTSIVTGDNKKAVVNDGFFYLTNQSQLYTLEIDQQKPTETFNIHFGEYWADQVFSTLTSGTEKLLDESTFSAPLTRIEFYNKLYARDSNFNKIITSIADCTDDQLLEEEKLYELLVCLLKEDKQIRKAERNLPVMKSTTRQELLKRLMFSTDYIYSYYHKDISLDELAAVACLSKFHFLRLFKIAFNKTPHQFVNEVKVERSKQLLKGGKTEVSSIARSLGFQNTSSFSRMFYQQTGVYPTQFQIK
jgi:AraC family transcriptional regulator